MSLEKELVDTAGLPRDDLDFAEPEPEGPGDDPGPSPAVALKTSEILAACTWRDATRLRALAESEGGLLADTLRQVACRYSWLAFYLISFISFISFVPRYSKLLMLTGFVQQGPILLGLPPPTDEKESEITHSADPHAAPLDEDWKDFPRHNDEDQVQLDVNRSFVHYPNGMSLNN
jgi:hypothetical protein